MSDPRPERRLAAVLATDVAGYSRLMGANEEATLQRLNTLNQAVIYPTVEQFRGRIIKTMGDGMLAEFASAVDAVRCAVTIQRGTASFNASLLEDEKLRLRIGVNIGDLIYQGSDVFGDGVNIAARLQSIAELDGIFVSQTVRDYVREEASFIFDDLGQHSLKNIERPVHVFRVRQPGDGPARPMRAQRALRRWPLAAAALGAVAIIAGGAGWYLTERSAPRPRATRPAAMASAPTTATSPTPAPAAAEPAMPSEPRFSLLVLPMRPVSGEAKDRFLSDGITDHLIAALGRLPGGLVIARDSAMTLRARGADAKAIAAELQVRYVVEGSMGRDDSGVHIVVRMIDGSSGEAVWHGRFEKERAQLNAAEAELVTSLGGVLGADADAIKKAVASLPASTGPANDLVLEGWQAAYRPASVENMDAAQALIEKALAVDHDNVEAQVALALVLVRNVSRPAAERHQRARRADEILTAIIARDPDHALAHVVKGQALAEIGRGEAALALFDQALALDPNLAAAWGFKGEVENRLGRDARSIVHVRHAIRLSPRDVALGFWLTVLGADEFATGAEPQALEDLRKASAANSRLALPYLFVAAICARQGDTAAAQTALAAYQSREPGATIAKLKQSPSLIRLTDALFEGLHKAGMTEQ